MLNYKKIELPKLNDEIINKKYKELLDNKWSFLIIKNKDKKYVLTKEKSIFQISDEEKFIQNAKNDIYYQTVFIEDDVRDKVQDKDLIIYYDYINKYKSLMTKQVYGEKYLFGSVAVRTNNDSFITTIRGKENFKEYTIVRDVDHINYLVKVIGKKATLNAPLLATIMENKKVKVIVHINHYFDDNLPYYEYAFPGTVRDSIRNNNTSFNIKYHGVIYLFDKDGNIL